MNQARPTVREELEHNPLATAFREAVAIMDQLAADLKMRAAIAERQHEGLALVLREVETGLTLLVADGCPCRQEFVCSPHRLLALVTPALARCGR